MNQPLKPIDLRLLLFKYLYHWPLFLFFIILTVGASLVYLKVTKPTFEIRATILVKDAKKTSEDKSALQELDQSEEAKIAENEVEVIRSRKMVSEAVDRLQLGIDYSVKGKWTTTNLYKQSPVSLIFQSENKDFKSFSLTIVPATDGFELLTDGHASKKVKFGETVNSEAGPWKLLPTDRLKQYIGNEISISINDPSSSYERYQNGLDVSLLNKLAPTISFTFHDKVKERGEDFLNALISNYILSSTEEKNKSSNSSVTFINKKIDSLKSELNIAEGAVQDFKSGNGLTDITSESQMYLENMSANDSKLSEINVQIKVINGLENFLNAPENLNNTPSTIGINDPILVGLVDRLSQLQVQKVKLLATTPANSYIFDPIDGQIKQTRNALHNNVKSIKATLVATRQELERFNAKFKTSISRIPGQERESSSLSRQQKAKEDLYNYLLQKRTALSLSYSSTLSDTRIIDSAYAGPVTWPRKAPVLAMSCLLGLLIPFSIIYVRTSLKDKVLTRKSIESKTSVPILGELPKESNSRNGLVDHRVNNAVSENFRAIRTRLYYLDKTPEKGKVVLVTSGVAGEGKSFISANLSTSFAFMGRKTLLIEMDLRRPKFAYTFNLSPQQPGLTEYLASDKLTRDQIIQQTNFDALDFISAGQLADNPAELLTSEKLERLINDLKEIYDEIIIDSPPIQLVADALIISRLAHTTIYVIRQGFTSMSDLDFLDELDKKNEVKNLQLVFNGVMEGKFGYGKNYSSSYYTQAQRGSFKQSFQNLVSRF